MKKVINIILFLTAYFGMTIISQSDQKKELDVLFNELKSVGSKVTALEIEQQIWNIWVTHPTDRKLTKLLSKGSKYMSENRLGDAYLVFTEVISLDENWAEAWNKRATVLYLMGEYEKSQNDIDRVLSLEKRHFGALSGQGLVQTALENYQKAIDSYLETHKIYPAMETPLIMIEKLKIKIKRESI